jgi:adenylate cyclase
MDIKRKTLSQISFIFFLVLVSAVAILYLYNIVKWGDLPDYGYGFRTATGVRVVGVVREVGRKAGLAVGDRILRVNGKTIANYKEMHAVRNREIGEQNTYSIERGGRQFEVVITNTPLGFKGSFKRSGFPYLVGVCFVFIGALVFLMKPHQRTSWAFLLFCSILGIFFMFLYKGGLMNPFEFENLNIFAYTFAPAVFIHLALSFPEERYLLKKHPSVQFLPYVASAFLFFLIRYRVPTMMDSPKSFFIIFIVYFLVAVLIFLGSCLQLRITSSSEIVKLRSRMILLGVAISASVPLLDTLNNALFRFYIVPSFNYYLPFFILFPIFLGYSVIKHNLFDFDVIIRRSFGYILLTGGISGVYALFLYLSQLAFGRFEIAESPLFPLLFILAVVFLLNPVRSRAQKLIDRVFFRLEYDYQAIVHKISETMRSLLSLDQIGKSIMDTALGDMFIDSGRILLLNPEKQVYEFLASVPRMKDSAETEIASSSATVHETLPADDLLVQRIAERKKEVTLYDIQEDPFYAKRREACKRSFMQLGASLIVPLIYEGQMTGFISLGDKKSGKYYQKADINLLKTLANQAAVAIENARMAEQMKNEEKMRANLARYLSPQIVDRVIQKDVQVNLGGDKKIVTVLFSDIRGFTRISETLPPDQLVQLLNEYFTEMAGIIFENQGSLDKFIGDAIVAVFGSLISIHNPARTAVQAAVQMMKTLETANQRWTAQYGFAIHIGIGINTGEVFLGNIGSPERMEFTVIGDTVNIASRLSGAAHPGQILVTRKTLAQIGSDLRHQELPPMEVKGKTGKQEVFEILYS